MVELLGERNSRFLIGETSVRQGISRADWPGRCQWVEGSPPILLDGAQNAASAAALRQTIETLFPGRPVTLLFGASTGKDLEGIAQVLGPWARRLILAQARVPRAEPPQRIAQAFRPWHPDPLLLESVPASLQQARESAGPEGLIVVTGSLFVVGEALKLLGRDGACAEQETESRRSLQPQAGSSR